MSRKWTRKVQGARMNPKNFDLVLSIDTAEESKAQVMDLGLVLRDVKIRVQ